MQSAKQRVSNAAASAKEHVDVLKAKAEEKVNKSTASTKQGKEMAKEQKKAKEAEAKMRKHEAEAGNAAQHLQGKQYGQFGRHGHHGAGATPVMQGNNYPTGAAAAPADPGHTQYDPAVPLTNAAAPTNKPLDGHQPGLN